MCDLDKDNNIIYICQSKITKLNIPTAFCEGPTMDIMLIKELFTNCITSASILGIEDELVDKLKLQKDNLQPYQIGSQGQLLEWDKEYKEKDPQHRHISHLYALSPGNEITKEIKRLGLFGKKSLSKFIQSSQTKNHLLESFPTIICVASLSPQS
jgi:hypothetical protein